MDAIQYSLPLNWLVYDKMEIFQELTDAKAAILALKTIPYQRRWVEELQKVQLKMEVAGTSRIEGADFAANELEIALRAQTPEQLMTRSQKQANCAIATYNWIAKLPDDRPVTASLISEIHERIVTGCDEDHCAPGKVRAKDQNVTYGAPIHRGAIGGPECEDALQKLTAVAQSSFQAHDAVIQALALHYHFAAIHPFQDGNGRTARALEALMLQRSGLKDALFIAMSNFYYDEKRSYLESLNAVGDSNHNLTAFLKFGLRGIALQTNRLAQLIKAEVSKQIFRNLMHDLFVRLESTRKRVIVKRQLVLLEHLLNADEKVEWSKLRESFIGHYASRKAPAHAMVRDVNKLSSLGAISVTQERADPSMRQLIYITVNLDWPTTITETEFFNRIEQMPISKTTSFLLPS
jgi:Fic family protein